MNRCPRFAATAAALVLVALSAAGAASAAVPIFTVGSSLGLDAYSQDGQTLTQLSSSPGSSYLLPASDAGLRLGMVLPGERTEVALQLNDTVISSGSEAVTSLDAVRG